MDEWDVVLSPLFRLMKTHRYSAISLVDQRTLKNEAKQAVLIDLNCPYTRDIVKAAVRRRPWCSEVESLSDEDSLAGIIQISDFENILWERVVQGKDRAASYLVRKGLSRKAQLSLQIRRFLSKHPTSLLRTAVPFTIILDTWNAFEEMKIDFGGGLFASFDTSTTLVAPLRQRLSWSLEDAREAWEAHQRHCDAEENLLWIIKPSVTNKGADISVVRSWDGVLDALERVPDIREWVLQRYIARPLLVGGHKFHLRVYVLCVGALQVFVFDRILMLLAAHKYDEKDIDDVYKHLTNTARSAEDIDFEEHLFVKLLDDLPDVLLREYPEIAPTPAAASAAVAQIRVGIHSVTAALFQAFENEYTVFAPMPHCFELFGLDFLVDQNLHVHLLEVNPGPDFKQTGSRLRGVIVALWEQVLQLVVDRPARGEGLASEEQGNAAIPQDEPSVTAQPSSMETVPGGVEANTETDDFKLVYSKEWSASKIAGGMSIR